MVARMSTLFLAFIVVCAMPIFGETTEVVQFYQLVKEGHFRAKCEQMVCIFFVIGNKEVVQRV